MFCWGCWGSIYEPDPGADQSPMELVGYQMSQKEMRDIYHSVYLLQRSPGHPLQRMTKKMDHSGNTLLPDGSTAKVGISHYNQRSGPSGRRVGRLDQQGSYEVALWAAHQRALETTEALQSDLERLGNE